MPPSQDLARALLQERCREAHTQLLWAASPRELGEAIGQQAGCPLVLADHPWLRRAVSYLPQHLQHCWTFSAPSEALPPPQVDTAVLVGLAAVPETGSVLLAASPGADWRLSLCPRLLVVVIPEAQAALSLSEALVLTAQESLVSWLTGPSRTADIEKVLVLGAQGAAALTVIIAPLDEAASGAAKLP
jgi:L-lactate utilization protein LutC